MIPLALVLFMATGEPTPLPPGFILVAHRGVVDEERQENSLAALEETIRRGYTHIEVDVRCTKDGHAVCAHDDHLMRATGVDLWVSRITIEELRAAVPEERVPSFATFCARCAGRIGVMVDVKDYPRGMKEAFVASLRAGLTAHDLLESALFIGRPEIGMAFEGEARLSWPVPLAVAKKARRAQGENPGKRYFIFNHAVDFNAAEVDGFHALGLPVIVSINMYHYYGHGDPLEQGVTDVERMLALGVDGLQIDSVYDPAVFAWAREQVASKP